MKNDEWTPLTRRQRYWSDVKIALGLAALLIGPLFLTVPR